MNRKIAVYLVHESVRGWNFTEEDLLYLQSELPEFSIYRAVTEEEFVRLLPEVGIAFTWKYADEWVERFPNVRVIGTPAAGADFLPSNLPEDITLIRGSFHGITMSETVIGMMLEHTRRLFESDFRMKHGELWPRGALDPSLRSLTGSHVVILGFGAIGSFTARRLKAFDCRITGVRRSAAQREDYFTEGDEIITFSELYSRLGTVDHLISFLPDNPQTDDLIGKRVFELLPEHAAFYSLGRGNCVNEEELIYALRNGPIAGAYLDVYKKEPLAADSPLRSLDNICLLPHSSAISPEYVRYFLNELPGKLRRL